MAKLTPKEQLELNRLKREQEKIEQKIADGVKIQAKTAEKYEQTLKRINQLKGKEKTLTEGQRDAEKEIKNSLTAVLKEQRKLNVSEDRFKNLKLKTLDIAEGILSAQLKGVKSSNIGTDLMKDQAELMKDILIGATDLESLRDIEAEQIEKFKEARKDKDNDLAKFYLLSLRAIKAKKKELELTEQEQDAFKVLDDMFGGYVSKAYDFLKKNPMAKSIAIALTMQQMLTKAISDYSKIIDEIGLRFGSTLVNDFNRQIGMSIAQTKLLGFESSDVFDVIEKLSSQFGFTVGEAHALVGETTDLARIMGTSAGEAAQLVGMFSKLTGITTDQSIQFAKQTVQLARISKVAPNVVMKDIAENTEFFAKYAKDGGKNIMEAAVEVRKLGLSLSTVEKISDGLLDFQSSLTAEYEASAILGRSLNLQRARELAMAGDQVGLVKEITKQVGSQQRLNKMTLFERRGLAKALNMEVSELSKWVANQDKARDTSKEISEMSFKELVGEDALSGLTLFSNALKTMGAILVQNFIPPIAFVLGIFGKLVGLLAESKVGMVLLSAVTGALALKMSVLSFAAIKGAAALVMKAFGLLSVSTGGFGLLGIGAVAGIVAGLYGLYASAPKMAKGGMVKASPGGTMATIGEGGENELITPLSKVGEIISIDTSAVANEISVLKNEMKQQNQLMNNLLTNMEGYFGFGGSAIKGIGRETIKAGESIG